MKAHVRQSIKPVMAGAEDEISDESLMLRVVNGDHQAFAHIVERHTQRFFACAVRYVGAGPEAEDVVQDAFLKLWQKPQSFDPSKGAKFTTWFTRVVTNVAIDALRKKKPQADPGVLDMIADEHQSADEALDEQGRQAQIEAVIGELPERQKMALNLCFYEGVSNKEAAEILGVGVKALESLLMRAKKQLKERLNV